jgi:hypothetical protein
MGTTQHFDLFSACFSDPPFDRYRRGNNKQTVELRHVHIHSGGPGVVGIVNQAGTRKADRSLSAVQTWRAKWKLAPNPSDRSNRDATLT